MEKLSIDAYPKFALAICITGVICLGVIGWFYEYISYVSSGI
jgi:hypothetical protein